MFDPYGMYGYDPRFAPNPGPQRPIPRPGYTDQPQGQNGQQAGPGWVFVPRVDDIVNVTVQPGGKAWIMAQDQPVFAVRSADQLGVTQTASGFARQQEGICETLRAIDGVNYNGALNTASINANTTAQVQRILDKLSADREAAQAQRISQLEMQQMFCGIPRVSPYGYGIVPQFAPFGCGCNNNI